MHTKRLLVLAHSFKKWPGRCVAGREVAQAPTSGAVTFGPWVRPVSPASESQEGELHPDRHCRTDSGRPLALLDLVEVPLVGPRPVDGQPENWEVMSGMPWRVLGRLDAARNRATLEQLEERPRGLWTDGDSKSDRCRASTAAAVAASGSLVLVRPSGLRFRSQLVRDEYREKERPECRAHFTYAGTAYALKLTDPAAERAYVPRAEATPKEVVPPFGDDCLLCVSLGAPFHGYHYKLVAAVLPLR